MNAQDQAPSLPKRIVASLGAQEENLARLAEVLETFCDAHGVNHATQFALNVVIDELVTNVVHYAFPEGGEHVIKVLVSLEDDELFIEIEDDGVAFDPLSLPEPDTEAEIEDREIGGLGVHIVRHLMDEVSYERVDGKNRLRLRKA